MHVIEKWVVPSAVGARGGDRIVVDEHIVAVLDAATAKPWDPPGGPSTSETADLAVEALRGTPADATMEDVVWRCSELLAEAKAAAGLTPTEGSCFVLAVVNTSRRWVARCGDIAARLAGESLWDAGGDAERAVARARALVVRAHLVRGETPESLREDDPGRAAVGGLLQALATLRNSTGPGGYGAVDGSAVPQELIQLEALGDDEQELVLASDGYPSVSDTLGETEKALRYRLRTDPLMIDEPPATKAWRPGERSFDDRAYVRLRVPQLGEK